MKLPTSASPLLIKRMKNLPRQGRDCTKSFATVHYGFMAFLGILSIVLSSVMVQNVFRLHEGHSWNDSPVIQEKNTSLMESLDMPTLQSLVSSSSTTPHETNVSVMESLEIPTSQSLVSSTTPQPLSFFGVRARTWEPYPAKQTLCFETRPDQRQIHHSAEDKNTTFPLQSLPFVEKYATDRGIVFLKPMKVGGSTAAGVNLRVAKNMAARLQMPFEYCENNFDHAVGYMMARRDRRTSFLWSLLREPTKRAISGFYHFEVSRFGFAPTDENFVEVLRNQSNYYLKTHSFRAVPVQKGHQVMIRVANMIMKNYDFMAITERFDESMVVLQMLLKYHGVTLGDILYVKAKSNGGYDDGGHNGRCTFIQPSNLTTGMKAFVDSKEWKKMVQWDLALYQAANRSLDLTIDKLGREEVARKLKLYQWAQGLVKAKCSSQAKLPCTAEGVKRTHDESNCLFSDSGCANECLDVLVTDELRPTFLP